MSRKITIDPVTRVEGHGRVTIHLDEYGQVKDSFFHIVEFRGFERFIQGHPYWEAPVLVQRLCGICPVSHHLAAAKAIDQIVGIDPSDLSPTATRLRRLMHYAQIFQSHALHFFYLASPDLLFGLDAPVEKRNIVAVAVENRALAIKGITMRKFGQEVIKAVAGKKIHGILAVPGGVHNSLTMEERDFFLDGKEIENIDNIPYGKLDITFFRDDFKTSDKIPNPSTTEINFLVENKRVILVDDVLYTGRTIQAALQALNHFGRPKSVELVVLVDRRFNRHLPIQADYVGLRVDALDEAYVRLEFEEEEGQDRVLIYDAGQVAV